MMSNGNTDRLLGEINERTKNIASDMAELKAAHADVTKDHHARIMALEMQRAETKGGWKMLTAVVTAAGTVGGLVGTFLGKFWS